MSGLVVDCATIDVPLDWEDPGSERITYFVRRIPSQTQPARGQAWLLVGGPGISGAGILGAAPVFASAGWDVYVPDYRGVGASTPLACEGSDPQTVTGSCLEELASRWGDGLRHFSTTGAAMDMGKTIEALRREGEEVLVFGGSYGTFLGNRYLHLFPGQADGAIFGGICPPSGCSLRGARNLERAAKKVFEACKADDDCRGRLGDDPWSGLEELYARMGAGHCDRFGETGASTVLSWILYVTMGDRVLSPAGLAAVYRMDRCEEADVTALRAFGRAVGLTGFDDSHGVPSRSEYLYRQVVLSEFWEPGLAPEDLLREERSLLLSVGEADRMVAMKEAWPWPRYSTPDSLLDWAPSTSPMLLMNGEIDPRTPVWDLQGMREAWSDPLQRFVELPFSGHGSHNGPCGVSLMKSFARDPEAPLDLSCVEALRGPDLEGSTQLARQTMGADDLWENGLSAQGIPTENPDRAVELALEAARLRARTPGW